MQGPKSAEKEKQLSRLTSYESNVVESLERPRFFQSFWTGANDDITVAPYCAVLVLHVYKL